jgi:hypothetical protein
MFKLSTYIIVSLVLTLFAILIVGNLFEHGDINAASMYPVVFLLPSIVMWFGMGIVMYYMNVLRNNYLFLIISILLSIGILFVNEYANLRGYEIYRVIIVLGFASNILYFGYKRIKHIR